MTSSNSYDATVDLPLGSSVRGVTVLLIAHALALILVLWAVPDGVGKVVAALLVALSWFLTRRHSSLGFGRKAVRRLLWHADGRWQLEIGGELKAAALTPHSVVAGPVPVLRFRVRGGGYVARILFGDEADTEALRRLRARLATDRS